jgi:hypothetical protein
VRDARLKAKPAGATLLVMCDLACDWKLDGEAKGLIDAGGSAKAKVEFGQHLVIATTEEVPTRSSNSSRSKSTDRRW